MTTEPSKLVEWLHSCVRCGNCKYIFRNYGPSCPSGEHFLLETFFASGRLWIGHAIQNGELEWSRDLVEPLFACTTCGACQIQCLAPHRDHIVDMIEELRAKAVDALGPLPAHKKFRDRIAALHNSYGAEHHSRRLVGLHKLPEKAPLVYFVGCTANYRETEILDATISVLKKSGLEFTIVDEHCCSSPLIRTGQMDLASKLAHHNTGELSSVGAKRVVTSCSGCYRSLKEDYGKLGFAPDAEVIHITHLLHELLSDGALTAKDAGALFVTYHDPCHLGRHCGVYEVPRLVLEKLPVELAEMQYNRENAWCCGAGGGSRSAYSEWSLETAEKRVQMAKDTGAEHLVSACPFCKRNLKDASAGSVEVIDIVELVDRLV